MKIYIGYIFEKAWDEYDADFTKVEKAFLDENLAKIWVSQYNSDVDRYDSRFYTEMEIDE